MALVARQISPSLGTAPQPIWLRQESVTNPVRLDGSSLLLIVIVDQAIVELFIGSGGVGG